MDIKCCRCSRDGVTLVEMITVLVILAVLAAMIIPSLLGFTDKVKERRYVLEAVGVQRSLQMFALEVYARGESDDPRTYANVLRYEVNSEKNPIGEYLTFPCSKGARIRGLEKDKNEKITAIVYEVNGLKITVNEEGTKVEKLNPPSSNR